MAYDVLNQQYAYDTIRNLMQGDKDSVNILKNRLTASKAIIDAAIANPAVLIPWYSGLSQAEKDKVVAWKNGVDAILTFITGEGY